MVVDNASPGRVCDMLARDYGNQVDVIRLASNTFYCGAANIGIAASDSEFVAILNDDCWVESDWVDQVISTFDVNPGAGSVASLVYRAGRAGRVDSAGAQLNLNGLACGIGWDKTDTELPKHSADVFSAAGACAAYRRSALACVGGFDEHFVAYYDDIDLGFRLQLAGHTCRFNPACRAHHVGGATHKARHAALFLAERNMLWTLAKNLPHELLVKHRKEVFAAQSRPARILGGSTVAAWGQGKAIGLAGMPRILRERQRVKAMAVAPVDQIERLLTLSKVEVCHL
jgi:GT2 family glycosyltransferase